VGFGQSGGGLRKDLKEFTWGLTNQVVAKGIYAGPFGNEESVTPSVSQGEKVYVVIGT
jgi:hypothetical protein